MFKNIIAIDGPAASGKSTVARKIAEKLDYQFISSGAMYRGVALIVTEQEIDISDTAQLLKTAEALNFSFSTDEENNTLTFIDGRDVTADIRQENIGNLASQIATNAAVRALIVKKLQKIGETGQIVMEGRDIQTTVFPDARVKLFLAASSETRAKRRFDELKSLKKRNKNLEISYDAILSDIVARDERDMNREVSPLKPAVDAVVINTDNKSVEQVVNSAINIVLRLTDEAPFMMASKTDMGYVREINEDGFFVYDNGLIMAIADGMGGHEHGEIASELALKEVATNAPKMAASENDYIVDAMYLTCQQANSSIYQRALLEGAEFKMGTTLIFTLLFEDRLYYLNVGDSRLYLCRNNELTRLTRDHSLVQEMVDNNEITEEEAILHPLRNRITKVVGYQLEVESDIASIKLQKDDKLLLCTDGLYSVVDEMTIKNILMSEKSALEKVDELIETVLAKGAPDNVTTIVAEFTGVNNMTYNKSENTQTAEFEKSAESRKKHNISILVTVILFLAVVLFGAVMHYRNPVWALKGGDTTKNHLYVYKTYPLLPFFNDREESGSYPLLNMDEIKPYLAKYQLDGDLNDGITQSNRDVAINTIYELGRDVIAGLIDELEHTEGVDRDRIKERIDELLADEHMNEYFKGWQEQQQIVKGEPDDTEKVKTPEDLPPTSDETGQPIKPAKPI